jgi:hypothetical protein
VPTNRLVPRQEEVVEFRPIPGAEDSWASHCYVERSRLWDYLGVFPIGAYLCAWLVMIGVAI